MLSLHQPTGYMNTDICVVGTCSQTLLRDDVVKFLQQILAVLLQTYLQQVANGISDGTMTFSRSVCTPSTSRCIQIFRPQIPSILNSSGSEGRLTFPYQRVGMINALREVSEAPKGKHFSSLSPTVCELLLSCYKDDGNEEVKLAALSCIAAWGVKSTDSISSDLVTLIDSGLREKETLRRGHLRCLRLLCKNSDTVVQMSTLLLPLLHLVKTGFTKPAQRLDGIYALLCVVKIAAVDVKADETVLKEKIWQLILQNEPTIIPITLASKLSAEDLMACADLVDVLLIDYSQRLLDTFATRALLQFLLFLLCHPNWDIRKAAHGTTKEILLVSPLLSEAILLEFSSYLSVVGEKVARLKMSDTESVIDNQVPFLPSVELLVKALVLIASAVSASTPNAFVQLLFCSHHPHIVGTGKKNAVWRRVQKCTQKLGFDTIGLVIANVAELCKGLFGLKGLLSSNHFEQDGAINTMITLMSIIPGDTYAQFEKHFINLPDRIVHKTLSEVEIQVLYHALGVVPAYHKSVGPAVNELCLGLGPDDVAPALYGVYAKDAHEEAEALTSSLLAQLMKSDKYNEHRGAAFGLAGVVKGYPKKYTATAALRDGLSDRNSAKCREGALLAFECFCENPGRLFEPYEILLLPLLLVSFSDPVVAVRESAEGAASAMVSKLSAQGVKLVLPSILKADLLVKKLLDELNAPSEALHRAVSTCLSPWMKSKKDIVASCSNQSMQSFQIYLSRRDLEDPGGRMDRGASTSTANTTMEHGARGSNSANVPPTGTGGAGDPPVRLGWKMKCFLLFLIIACVVAGLLVLVCCELAKGKNDIGENDTCLMCTQAKRDFTNLLGEIVKGGWLYLPFLLLLIPAFLIFRVLYLASPIRLYEPVQWGVQFLFVMIAFYISTPCKNCVDPCGLTASTLFLLSGIPFFKLCFKLEIFGVLDALFSVGVPLLYKFKEHNYFEAWVHVVVYGLVILLLKAVVRYLKLCNCT